MKLIYHPGTGTVLSLDEGLMLIDTTKVPPSIVADALDGGVVAEAWTRRITDVVTVKTYTVTIGFEVEVEATNEAEAIDKANEYNDIYAPDLATIEVKEEQ